AISFACERYAMSLPDIEAYIEQKLPVEQVTADLLVPMPRTPRPTEGEDAGETESVSAIYREVREAKAAEDERRGGGRSGGRSGSSGGGRSGSGSRGAGAGPRRERRPAPVEGAEGAAVAPAASEVPAAEATV